MNMSFKNPLTVWSVIGVVLLGLATGCGKREEPQPQERAGVEPESPQTPIANELSAQGFTEAEIRQIASLVKTFEDNIPTPQRPSTENRDRALASASAGLMAFGDRLLPFMRSRAHRASKANDDSTEIAYTALLEAMKQVGEKPQEIPATPLTGTGNGLSITVNAPPEWREMDSLPEAKGALLILYKESLTRRSPDLVTLAEANAVLRQERERPVPGLAWVAFTVETFRLPKGEPQYTEYSRFAHARVNPFGTWDGSSGKWPHGKRNYWQLAWTPKRKIGETGFRAQTSVIWDWDKGIRFEILQIVSDDGDTSAFANRFGDFVFAADITKDGREMFPK